MIKFSFFRTQPPKRDWVRESDAPPTYQHSGRHRYVTEVESYRDRRRGEHTWNWLCGLTEYQEEYHPAHMLMSWIPLSQIQLYIADVLLNYALDNDSDCDYTTIKVQSITGNSINIIGAEQYQ